MSRESKNQMMPELIPSCYLSPHERLLAHATLHCFPVVSFKLTITEAAPVVKEINRMKMPKKTYFDNALNIFYFRTNDGYSRENFLVYFVAHFLINSLHV